MSSRYFRMVEHVLEASHIRSFPRATATSQEEVLNLKIKQYTPLDNPNPQPGDITIIGAHANGYPKELYEPLWDELLQRSKANGFSIRGIWIADVVHQGWSSVENESKLGNDPAWLDHSRDLLHMVNTFRAQMPRPLIGVGHSMGGCQLANLALIHPRLLETLILIDPVIMRVVSFSGNISPAVASFRRRDRWPSRAAAAEAMLKNKYYQAWDRRVFDRWIEHGLRELPTAIYPSSSSTPGALPSTATTEPTLTPAPPQPKEVTLTTTKHQEVMTFLRPNIARAPDDPEPSSDLFSVSNPTINRRTHPDLTPGPEPQSPFYRGESIQVFHQLPHLRPSVFYIFGRESFVSTPESIADKMAVTGTGPGGSGGEKEGRVAQVTMEETGHLIPMEKVGETAENMALWLKGEMARWREAERLNAAEWEGRTGVQRSLLPKRFEEELEKFAPRKKRAEKL